MMVNHNCYTNVLGKKTFEYTLAVLDEMRAEAPELYREAVAKTDLTPEEPERWAEMADKMRIPKDEQTGILEQHAGYFDLPHVDLEHLPADQIPIYKNWAYVKIFRFNMVKQPDVLNLMYFFSQDYTLEEKRANYEFYEARTIHESSLSPSLHAILAVELGKLEDAYTLLLLRRADGPGQLQPEHRPGTARDVCGRRVGQHGLRLWRNAHGRRRPHPCAGPCRAVAVLPIPRALPRRPARSPRGRRAGCTRAMHGRPRRPQGLRARLRDRRAGHRASRRSSRGSGRRARGSRKPMPRRGIAAPLVTRARRDGKTTIVDIAAASGVSGDDCLAHPERQARCRRRDPRAGPAGHGRDRLRPAERLAADPLGAQRASSACTCPRSSTRRTCT